MEFCSVSTFGDDILLKLFLCLLVLTFLLLPCGPPLSCQDYNLMNGDYGEVREKNVAARDCVMLSCDWSAHAIVHCPLAPAGFSLVQGDTAYLPPRSTPSHHLTLLYTTIDYTNTSASLDS